MTSSRRDSGERATIRERTASVLEGTDSLIWAVDLDTDELISVDGPVEPMFGVGEETLDHSTFIDRIHPDDRSEVERRYSAVKRGDADEFAVEFRTRPGDGEVRWVEATASRGTGAESRQLLGLLQDVTSRKARERRLERYNADLRRLHESANRLYAADAVEECYEITIEAAVDILGFDWCTVAAPADDEDTFEIKAVSADAPLDAGDRPFGTDEGLAGQVYRTGEASIVDDVRDAEPSKPTDDAIRSAVTVPVGEWGVFQAVATTPAAFDDGDRKHAELLVTSMLTAVERIDQQAELQDRRRALERQNARLEKFASMVSHDLRNPLSVAEGYLELADEEGDPAYFERAAESLDRMNRIIEDMLWLAREDQDIGATESFALGDAVDGAWRVVADEETEADLRYDPGPLGVIEADYDRVSQLLENLLANAIEHGGDGVTIRVEPTERGFAIEDTGPGVPESIRDRVFERGFSTRDRGTGYGLAIVEQIVDAHGWSLRLTDGSEGGARFEVTGIDGETAE